MKKTVYLAHYSVDGDNRSASPAGLAVMSYLMECLKRNNTPFTVLSSAQASARTDEVTLDQDGTRIVFPPSPAPCNKKNIIGRAYNKIYRKINMYKYLDSMLSDGDTLIVYHSLQYIDIIKKLRAKKKIELVLQVCEIYADVILDEKVRKKELEFFGTADKYIFQSELLCKAVNSNNKPYAVLHGTYHSEQLDKSGFGDGRTHCVYAGTLDPRKGGANMAASAALCLGSDYHIHILGFGTDAERAAILTKIDEISQRTECTLTFDGLKRGKEYTDFIRACDIGLCTQTPDADFNATSFPSKILSYMSNGLKVVSIRIPAIEGSRVSDDITYYDEQLPERLAEAISVARDRTGLDPQRTIAELDLAFSEALKKLV